MGQETTQKQPGEEVQKRLSKKERLAAKKAAKQAKKGGASDDEDIGPSADGDNPW